MYSKAATSAAFLKTQWPLSSIQLSKQNSTSNVPAKMHVTSVPVLQVAFTKKLVPQYLHWCTKHDFSGRQSPC